MGFSIRINAVSSFLAGLEKPHWFFFGLTQEGAPSELSSTNRSDSNRKLVCPVLAVGLAERVRRRVALQRPSACERGDGHKAPIR